MAAVKPGGWLVVEDVDILISTPDQLVEPNVAEAFARAMAGSANLIQMRGGDMTYGRRLYRDMRARLADGGDYPTQLCTTRRSAVAAGALTAEELALTLVGLQSPSFFATGILTMAVGTSPGCVTCPLVNGQ